jgi:hypothetical protein
MKKSQSLMRASCDRSMKETLAGRDLRVPGRNRSEPDPRAASAGRVASCPFGGLVAPRMHSGRAVDVERGFSEEERRIARASCGDLARHAAKSFWGT